MLNSLRNTFILFITGGRRANLSDSHQSRLDEMLSRKGMSDEMYWDNHSYGDSTSVANH